MGVSHVAFSVRTLRRAVWSVFRKDINVISVIEGCAGYLGFRIDRGITALNVCALVGL